MVSSTEQTIERIAHTITEQIHDDIQLFLEVPYQVNEANHKIIANDILDLSNEILRDRFFVGVLTSVMLKSIASVMALRKVNTMVRAGTSQCDRDYEKRCLNRRELMVLFSGRRPDRWRALRAVGQIRPRTRAWYKAAEEAKGPSYSP